MRTSRFVRLGAFVVIACLATALPAVGQHEEANNIVSRESHGLHFPPEPPDTTIDRFRDIFTRGRVGGHLRYYFMSTQNMDGRPDYYANALGFAIKAETANWQGFQIGMSGIATFNVGSSALAREVVDSAGQVSTERLARYEAQLFDVEHPDERWDLDRMEELFLRYHRGEVILVLGRQDITTPLVNPQDTRMKPYVVEGVWSEVTAVPKLRLNGGFFWRSSARGTIHWYRMDKAIGTFAEGVTTGGETANYRNNLNTLGVGIAGAKYTGLPQVTLQAWHYYLHNIMHTNLTQVDYSPPVGGVRLIAGGQYLVQTPIDDGGNAVPRERYYDPAQRTHLVSGRLGLNLGWMEAMAAGTHIAGTGRFVFPREWGREHFYTTIGRGRLEGLGGATQFGLKIGAMPLGEDVPLSVTAAMMRTIAPDASDAELNKYGQSDWDQLNVDLKYDLEGFFKGTHLRILYVLNLARQPEELAAMTNRADFHQINAVVNFEF